jgi:hypothetical protein
VDWLSLWGFGKELQKVKISNSRKDKSSNIGINIRETDHENTIEYAITDLER